eukprot:TRINITY_DN27054_c0_g2_i1.p1 TRINITY_DN27054_c0_g2~~TRINITY_DN27054_c0_g2_i1.p1  ORF type:complete len:615 (+),score=111.29 TRINITY_DN27054_c0_g2_i1:105-1949(+)
MTMAVRRQNMSGTSEGYRNRAVGSPSIASVGHSKNTREAMSRRAPAKPMPQQRASNSRPPPSMREVIAAVTSLYADQLKPYGRILRKRLTELAQTATGRHADADPTPDVDIRQLRNVCCQCSCLRVQDEEGGDWSAVLINRAPNFIDIYSPRDDYHEGLWRQAEDYFANLSEDEMTLPGGRYACAQVLVSRKLPFLKNCSLGQACHIVQLAISQKKVLGYLNGSVVPYGKSQSMVKEDCARSQKPCAGPGRDSSGLKLADWSTARHCLQEILETAASSAEKPGPGTVPLSNVKRLFRSRFNIELSETSLGHSKLSELLQDKQFEDVCRVKLEGHGYIVVQHNRTDRSVPTTPPKTPLTASSSADHLYLNHFSPDEPAKVLLGVSSIHDSTMMYRPRPAPLSENSPFNSDSNDAENCEWYVPVSRHRHCCPSPAGECSTASESTTASMLGELSHFTLNSALPSPAGVGPSLNEMCSPNGSLCPGGYGDYIPKALACKYNMPPPPRTAPPPPPSGLAMPPGLGQVRPPPGLSAPPGLETMSVASLHESYQMMMGMELGSVMPEDKPESGESPSSSGDSGFYSANAYPASCDANGAHTSHTSSASDVNQFLCLSNHV